MINYSIFRSSFIFSEWEQFEPEYEEISISDSLSLQVERYNNDNIKVVKVISTDPKDYLKSNLMPGNIYKNSDLINLLNN